MQTINERIAIIRSTLDISMDKFGKKIGITRGSVNNIEKNVNQPSEQTIKLICKEFNVDYFWLTEGKGEMFTGIPNTLLDEIAYEFNLDTEYKIILETLLTSPKEQKEAIKNFLTTLAENLQKKGEE